MNRNKSDALFKEAQLLMPGGVNSPVRAFKNVGGKPIFFKSAKGPILIDEDYTIIAGHARYTAASNLDLSMVPTLMAKGWTDKQKQAFVIADNRISENSSWDMGLLHSELKQLADSGFDVDLTGFDNSMLANFTLTIMPSMSYNEISSDDIVWSFRLLFCCLIFLRKPKIICSLWVSIKYCKLLPQSNLGFFT